MMPHMNSRTGKTLPHRWKTGPDPWVRTLKRKWLLAKNQARHWCQRWSISWPWYYDFMKQAYAHGRDLTAVNFARIDKRKGWTTKNVQLITRKEAVTRKKSRDRHGNVIKRRKRNDG